MAWLLVISYLVTLLAVLLLARLVSRWLLELLGERWYVIILWPGVVIHELSHLLGALLTFTRVTGFSLWPKSLIGGKVLGSVAHQATNNPLTLVLISIFPLLGGAFILWLLAVLLLPQVPLTAPLLTLVSGAVVGGREYLTNWAWFMLDFLSVLKFSAWQTWLFIYFAFAISAHLAPSSHDLGHTAAGFTGLSILSVLLLMSANLVGQSVGDVLTNWLAGALSFLAPLLAYALALLLSVALLLGLAVGLKRLNERVVWWG
jgi:hypothetical protein